jgi:Fe-S cluster biogenesis protein NfuA
MALADILVAQFERMVRRDGGSLTLLGVEDGVIRVGYRLGADPTCEDGACVLPHIELQDLMNETAARREPGAKVVVQLLA